MDLKDTGTADDVTRPRVVVMAPKLSSTGEATANLVVMKVAGADGVMRRRIIFVGEAELPSAPVTVDHAPRDAEVKFAGARVLPKTECDATMLRIPGRLECVIPDDASMSVAVTEKGDRVRGCTEPADPGFGHLACSSSLGSRLSVARCKLNPDDNAPMPVFGEGEDRPSSQPPSEM